MRWFAVCGLLPAWLATTSLGAYAADAVLDSIRVPEGFTIERVAAAPLVEHPVMAGFDDRGRLFVADNAGLNLNAEDLLAERPNMIRMLEDTDGDGRFDRSTVFADQMTFPQGAAWYRGALYVASPPEIWRLEDTDGDGVADKREELVEKFGFIGNAADIHGCFITPTGRIAWCDGRHGHEFANADGTPTSKGLAARVFSCRPDSSDVEVFCGGGMDNPVEVAFLPTGDTVGTMTFYNPDDARHDAIVHFVYGGVYPRKHPCTSEFKRTGELMPALSLFGVTAPSGLMCYQNAAWGDAYRDNLFSAQFNTHKVLRHVLAPQGATYECRDEDFLASDHVDFHPTDVLEDADGSLLVIDTGGWFRIGCPTSQIAKPEVGGAIYRIRKADSQPLADPRGLKMDWERISDTEMADLLSDPRPAVVERTVELLAERGDAAMGSLATALFENPDYRARQQAVWALARNGSDNAKMLLRQVLSDDDARVRQAATNACGVLRDSESLPVLLDLIQTDEPAVKRESATALGRLRDKTALPVLLNALEQPGDRFGEHAIIYALIEIGDPAHTRAGLHAKSAATRRGALIALDQMSGGNLTSDEVSMLLKSADPPLVATIVDILSRHPQWVDQIVGVLGAQLAAAAPSEEQLNATRGAIAVLGDRPEVGSLVAEALASRTAKSVRLMLLESIAAAKYDQPPDAYNEALAKCLESTDDELLRQTLFAVGALDARPFAAKLLEIGQDARRSTAVRLAAFQAAGDMRPLLSADAFEFISQQLRAAETLGDRLAAAEALGRAELTTAQLNSGLAWFAQLGPIELSWLLQAYEKQHDEKLGLALVDALGEAAALDGVSPDRLASVVSVYPQSVQDAAQSVLRRARPDDAERAARLTSLESSLAQGDAARGEQVFYSTRAACSACHRIGVRGERIGPDLSKIGEVRTGRDLLEAILYPSASLARGYESFHVVLADGKVQSGMLSRESASAIFLRTTERAELRVPRDTIEEMSPSRISIMPQGLDKTLTPQELGDLVAYLRSLK
jgi:putative membrane-bound dehydrogenase-like protein